MDQKDFEEMASIGERPVGGLSIERLREVSTDRNNRPIHFILSTPNEPSGFHELYVNNCDDRDDQHDYRHYDYGADPLSELPASYPPPDV